jgi:hypothetical protein
MCPRIRKDRQLDWNTDEEMGRMLFAGQNPNVIFQVKPDWLLTTAFKDEQVAGACKPKERGLTPPLSSDICALPVTLD